MMLKMSEVLTALYVRLSSDAPMTALVGSRVYNHVPQSTPTFPYIRFFVVTSADWSTKQTPTDQGQGLDQEIQIDVWSQERGDLQTLTIADAVIAATHNLPLVLPSTGAAVMLQHMQTLATVEGDGITHHGIIRLRQLASSS